MLSKTRRVFWLVIFSNAYTDVAFRLLITLMLTKGNLGQSNLLMVTTFFYLPFLFCSGFAASITERYDKRSILLFSNIIEFIFLLVALVCLPYLTANLWLAMGLYLFLTIRTVLQTVCCYACLKALGPRDHASIISTYFSALLFTVMFAASITFKLADTYGVYMVMYICIGFSAMGILATYFLPNMVSKYSVDGFSYNPFSEIFKAMDWFIYNKKLALLLAFVVSWLIYTLFYILQGSITSDLAVKTSKQYLDYTLAINFTCTLAVLLGVLIFPRFRGLRQQMHLLPMAGIITAIGLFVMHFYVIFSPIIIVGIAIFGFGLGLLFCSSLYCLIAVANGPQLTRVLAGAIFLSTIGAMFGNFMILNVRVAFDMSLQQVLLFTSFLIFAASCWGVYHYPLMFFRLIARVLTGLLYKIRIIGHENIPQNGAALLISNHVSYADPIIISTVVPRLVRYVMFKPIYDIKAIQWVFKMARCIPIKGGDDTLIQQAVNLAREQLLQGHVVCIFAEGGITRTGHLQPFKSGFERIAHELNIPIIAVHLDRMRDSIFAYKEGKIKLGVPEKLPFPATISFSKPLASTTKAWQLRQKVQELAADAQCMSVQEYGSVAQALLRSLRTQMSQTVLVDQSGKAYSRSEFLLDVLHYSRELRKRHELGAEIGLLFDISYQSTLMNAACAVAGVVAINLPETVDDSQIESLLAESGLSVIYTEKSTLNKLKLRPRTLYSLIGNSIPVDTKFARLKRKLEVLTRTNLSLIARYGRVSALFSPLGVVFDLHPHKLHGVLLSNMSVLANVHATSQLINYKPGQNMLAVQSRSHAYGYTTTLWLPLLMGVGMVLINDDMNIELVKQQASKYRIHHLVAGLDFYQLLIDKIDVKYFNRLKSAVFGLSRNAQTVQQQFEDKFNLPLLEGFGLPELGPGISVNVPNFVADRRNMQQGQKDGSVGQPLPGIAVKVVAPDTLEELSANQLGLLMVKSDGMMLDYWCQPNKVAPIHDGWFLTNEWGSIDEDGFIFFAEGTA